MNKKFDTVKFFRAVKEKLADKMAGMTLEQQKDFLNRVGEGKIKLVSLIRTAELYTLDSLNTSLSEN